MEGSNFPVSFANKPISSMHIPTNRCDSEDVRTTSSNLALDAFTLFVSLAPIILDSWSKTNPHASSKRPRRSNDNLQKCGGQTVISSKYVEAKMRRAGRIGAVAG